MHFGFDTLALKEAIRSGPPSFFNRSIKGVSRIAFLRKEPWLPAYCRSSPSLSATRNRVTFVESCLRRGSV